MSFTLLYFAAAHTFTNKQSEIFPAPMKLEELFPTLEKRYPGISKAVLDASMLTVNLEYVSLEPDSDEYKETVLNAGDEVAIIPPVSSG